MVIIMKCPKCETELTEDMKFCPSCGEKIERETYTPIDTVTNEPIAQKTVTQTVSVPSTQQKTIADRVKDQCIVFWGKLSLYGKIITVSLSVFTILCLIAFLAGKTFSGIISMISIVLVIIALLIKKEIIKTSKMWLHVVALILSAILIIPYFSVFRTNRSSSDIDSDTTIGTSVSNNINAENESSKGNNIEEPSDTKPFEITITMAEDDFHGMNYKEAEKIFREMGFTSFEYETVDTKTESDNDTICYIEIAELFIGNSDFVKGDTFDITSTVTFFSYKYEAPSTPSPVFYSTNDYETAKKGNTGVFSYKNKSGSYDIYYIIDFDEGYVYWFTEGIDDMTCDKIKIVSGNLNNKATITWHDGGNQWSWYLHFKYENHPETLIVNDQNGFSTEFTTTDLNEALKLRNTKKIKEY